MKHNQEFIINESTALIPITNSWCFAIIDLDDIKKVKEHNTHFHFCGRGWDYVRCLSKKLKRYIYLSEIISGKSQDHINRNKLDNRKCNLRYADNSDNCKNKTKTLIKTLSKYKGVSKIKDRRKKKWVARINVNGNQYNLGYFNTEKEAAEAYNKAALELHGEFAVLNVIKEKELN